MRKSKEQENFYITQIRRLIVIDPDMSAREIQEHLAENNLRLDDKYVAKLKEKIYKQRSHSTDRQTLHLALGKMSEALKEVIKEAWITATRASTKPREKVMALKLIADNEVQLFEMLFDAGVFNRKLGEIDLNVIRDRPISSATIDGIVDNMKKWGFDLEAEPEKKLLTSVATEKPSNGNDKQDNQI